MGESLFGVYEGAIGGVSLKRERKKKKEDE